MRNIAKGAFLPPDNDSATLLDVHRRGIPGLGYMRLDDADLADRLLADQRLLKLPLVRIGNGVAAGRDEAAWKALLARAEDGTNRAGPESKS